MCLALHLGTAGWKLPEHRGAGCHQPPATKLRESQWRTQHFTSKIPKSCPEFLGHKKHVLRFFLIYNNFWPWNNVSCFQTTVSALGLLVSSDSKKHAECEALQPTSEPLICKQEKNKIKQSKRWIRTLTSDVSLTSLRLKASSKQGPGLGHLRGLKMQIHNLPAQELPGPGSGDTRL